MPNRKLLENGSFKLLENLSGIKLLELVTPTALDDRRLLEDGSFRLFEDLSGVRLLESESIVVYGKFVAGQAFPPVQAANLGDAKPRIYIPGENNVIKSKS